MQRTAWIAAFALFTSFSLGVWLIEIFHDRTVEQRAVDQSTATTTGLLKEHAERALEAGTLILALMLDMAEDGDLAPERRGEMAERLQAVVDRSPQIGAAWVLDAEGTTVLDTWSIPPAPGNYAYREYFQVHQGGRDDLYIGKSETGSTSGRPRFTLSRPLLIDGVFRGVAAVNVEAEYFEQFYQEAGLGRGSGIHLVTLGGRPLAGWSDGPEPSPELLAEILTRANERPSGSLRLGEGDAEIAVSFSTLPAKSLVVFASRPVSAALAGWEVRALSTGLMTGAALSGFALLMLMGLRTARRERTALQDLRQTQVRLEHEVAERSAEAERRKQHLRVVSDALPALISYVDRDGRYRFVNRTYETWFGRPPEEVIGRTPKELIGAEPAPDAPQRRQAAMNGQWVVYDTVLPMPDGSRREVEVQYIPHTGPEGETGGFYAFVVDVTARRAAERALRSSEQRYRSLFESMDQGFGLHEVTPDGRNYRYLEINPAFERLTGLSAEQVIGRTVREVLPEMSDAFIDRFVQVARTGEAIRFEEFVAPLNRWYEIYAFATGTGRFATLFDDITERKQAAERQTLLMAELDHRVRNILAAVQSMVLLTARSASSKEQYAEILRGRVAAMARAHGLLTQCGWRGARLDQIVRDELAPYAGHAGGVTIEGPGTCMLKPKEALNFALVLHELTTNAAKYGALSVPEGHVTVRWRVEDDAVHLAWEESGGPRVTPPDRRGFGSVLIETALAGDGATTVDLAFPPEGVRCAVTLPRERLADMPPPAAVAPVTPPPPVHAAAPAPPATPRVLIVEDESLVALEMANALKLAGFVVVGPAAGLSKGLTLAAHESFDIAVLDVNLNGKLSTPIADVLVERGIPFLIASGYDIQTILPPHLRGAPSLQKPVDSAVLAARLREILGRAGQTQLTERPAAPQS